jgi:hypothetical protein
MSIAIGVQKSHKVLQSTTGIVIHNGTIALEKFKGGEAFNTVGGSNGAILVLVSINFSDNTIFLRGKHFGDLFINGSHRFAVTGLEGDTRTKEHKT